MIVGKKRFAGGLYLKTAGGSEVRGRSALVGEGKVLAGNSSCASLPGLIGWLLGMSPMLRARHTVGVQ